MKLQINLLRTWSVILLIGIASILRADAATSTGISPSFTVDLQVNTMSVSGRVLNAANLAAISGATVSLAGQNTSSGASGAFSFASIALNSGSTITVSRSGFATYTGVVPIPAGSTAVTLPDILLQPMTAENANKPIVTKVEPRLRGMFLSGTALNNDFTASVNWNGNTPGYVRFLGNGVQIADKTGSGPEYVASIDMSSGFFRPSFSASANKVTVQAVGSGGETSEPFDVYVGIIPVPDAIKQATLHVGPLSASLDGHIGLDFDLPDPPIEANLNLPVLGRFGFGVAANASFDYTVTDGDWEAAIGLGAESKLGKRGQRPGIPGLTRTPKMKLHVGNKEITGKIQAGLRGTATIQQGITFDTAFGHGEIGARLELGRVGLLDLMGPGLSTSVSAIPGLGDLTKSVSVIIYVIPAVEGDMTFALKPAFAFNTLEMTGRVGLEAAYEPNLTESIRMRLYVGGEPSVTIQVPGDLLKNLRFKAYAGAEFEAWVFRLGPIEYVFVDVAYPSGAKSLQFAEQLENSVVMMKVASPDAADIRPVSRDYLKTGKEGFSAREGAYKGKSADKMPPSALEAFRRIGKTPAKGSPNAKGGLAKAQASAAADLFQVDLTIASNVFPGSEPALANNGQDLMLLYVADNGSTNDLQFTDIRWTRWNGTDWSVPTTLHTNTQAEFAPQVVFDGDGNAIAVWERVADADFNQTNLTAMAAEMEIVWSKWNFANNTWSIPVALTTNSALDHAPLLCGPMADGSVLAVWTRNDSNLLMGTNARVARCCRAVGIQRAKAGRQCKRWLRICRIVFRNHFLAQAIAPYMRGHATLMAC